MMSRRGHRGSFVVGLVCALALGHSTAQAGVPLSDVVAPPPVHPHRIIVKYRSTVSACAHCLLARGSSFASVTGSASLDRLNRRFRVRDARALFYDDDASGARSAGYRSVLNAVRLRHPGRASRAPAAATLPDLSNVFVLELAKGEDPMAAAAAFAADPDVEYAEPDYQVHVSLTPNDPFFSGTGSWGQSFPDLWGLQAAQAAAAWDTARGDGVVVAVIDTGVKYTHRDLENNMWTNPGEIPNNRVDDDNNGYVDDVYGWDFVKDRPKPKDRHGHGTHVAGTIAATGNNGLGVIGMAWGARVMAVRGLDSRGYGYTSDLAKAIVYAAENGADVLNNSWGGFSSSDVEDAVQTATALGAVVVFSAGNSNSIYLGPAEDPRVIAVAATDPAGARASFSNYGSAVSVAAPGVDVLSTSGPGRVGGKTVSGRYRVLTGTSMAAPHVSGLAAVLLSQAPQLTVDEVRWHIELNADQPGYPGYEGQRFNPYFGYGQINAARVFDLPPVTSRICTPAIELHAFADSVVPDAAAVEFSFTTRDPVDWWAFGPAWLAPAVASGTGPATFSLTLDGTGLAAGTYSESVGIAAPAAVDGGAAVAGTVHVHQDFRVGAEIEIGARGYGSGPDVASDGQGVLAAWVEYPSGGGIHLVGARVDDAGGVTGPFIIDPGGCIEASCFIKDGEDVAVAFDGANYLVVWHEHINQYVSELSLRKIHYEYVKAVRVTPSGQVLDVPPIEVAVNSELMGSDNSNDEFFYDLGVAFDGTAYTVLWGKLDFGRSPAEPVQAFVRRVGTAGTLLTAVRQIYPAASTVYPQYIEPKIACGSGSCLVAWHEADGETSPEGKYIDKLYGQRYAADVAVDGIPFRILTDIENIAVIAGSGDGYFVAGYRANLCPGPTLCGYDIVGARVGADATALDPTGIRLNNSGGNGSPTFIMPNGATFDGTNYIVTWCSYGASYSGDLCQPFAARVGLDGSVIDSEPEGVLLGARPTLIYSEPAIAATATKSFIVWDEFGTSTASPSRILAQGIFAH